MMERYRVRANLNGNHSQGNSFQTKSIYQVSLPPKPPVSSYLHPQNRHEDSELSIFDAKHYFNEFQQSSRKKAILLNGIDEKCDSSTNRDSSVSSVDGYARNWRNRSFRATPTSSSEASWNSQSGLLANPPGSAAVSVRAFPLNEKRRDNGGSPSFSASRRFFGRNCPCYGKKSVDVEEKFSEPKSPVRVSGAAATSIDTPAKKEPDQEMAKMKIPPKIWGKDPPIFPTGINHRIVSSTGFTFPILAAPPPPNIGADDPARDSLEVFRPQATAAAGDDDVASDTSSDLFEIESFSTQYSAAYRRRDSLDDFPKAAAGILGFRQGLEEITSSITPSECYAPSEVSVEWSVTTAEPGFDRTSLANFSSAGSDYDGVRFIQNEHDRFGSAMLAGNKKKGGGGGGLLSCRSENSVNVGPSPVRIGPEKRRTEPEITRFAREKAELVRSHSVRMNRPVQTR